MRRQVTIGLVATGAVVYVWFAAVRNVPEVRRRKAAFRRQWQR